jgi:NADH-quinone oxidoreductase subunit L
MIARTNVLYRMSPTAMMVVALVGAATALFAATIGIRQNDIKKVLAYSTVSQLGFMFMGVGVGAFAAGVFHLVTHAFFKACLFLGSGSVIHAMSGEQDIRRMGGLWKKIPITAWTFLIATIAIAGFPPFSGFFSKDEILASAWSTPYFPTAGKLVYVIGTIAALFTAFYMFRLFFLTFFGKFRGTHEQEHHLHESPPSMTVPLIILAFLSFVGGFIGLPHVIGHNWLGEWLHPLIPEIPGVHSLHIAAGTEWLVMIISTIVAIIGFLLARKLYRGRELESDDAFGQRNPGLAAAIENKYYVDELYAATIVGPLEVTSRFLWKVVDAIIDGIAAMLGFVVRGFGDLLRFFQTGNVRNYALMFFLGVVVFLFVLA